MTKLVNWKGDYSNEPKSGVATIAGDMAHIVWSDGSKMVAPLFTLKPHYGWTVSDA